MTDYAEVDEVIQQAQNDEPFLDQAALDAKLEVLKNLDFERAETTIYLTEVSPLNKKKRCLRAKNLPASNEFKGLLKSYVTECISGYEHIIQLKEINTTQDNRFFYVEQNATDFGQVLHKIDPPEGEANIGDVGALSELSSYNSYVIQLTIPKIDDENDDVHIYAFHYFAKSWKPSQSKIKRIALVGLEATVDETPIFKIEPYIDFICFDDDLFIANANKFETAMRYKDRLEDRKLEAANELAECGLIRDDSKQELLTAIGSDKHLMRQFASAQSLGYYQRSVWRSQLQTAVQVHHMGAIEFDDANKVIIRNNKPYIKELLTLLQDKRVKTVVSDRLCDVDGNLEDVVAAVN